jgi:hypothetical protein
MLKKSYLTPVLSGVLAVTVIGSGAAYWNTFVRNADSADGNTAANAENSLTIDSAADNIEEQLDKVQKIIKGEYEGAYTAELTYSPSSDISDAVGTDISDISLSIDAKQKDKLTGVDYALNYDSKTLISANLVYDNAGETAYIRFPELSDAYLTGTIDEITQMLEDSGSSLVGYAGADVSSDLSDIEDLDLDAIQSVDFDALFDDLDSYGDTIKENAPDPTDGSNKTGSVDGANYEFTTKVYNVTADDAAKICNAIADKGRADSTLKDALINFGMTESDYSEIWNEISDAASDDSDNTVTVEVYYDGEDVAGWNAYPNDGSGDTIKMISYSSDDQLIVDWDITTGGEQQLSATGVVDLVDGDTLNGSINMNLNDGSSTTAAEISYDNLKATEDVVTGTMTVTVNPTDSESSVITYNFDCTADKTDVSYNVTSAGTDLGTFRVTAQETAASDITVPTGTTYKLTDDNDLTAYIDTLDASGWTESLQEILGDDLYNMLFGMNTYDDDYSYDDYSYDYDDYDFDDDDYSYFDYDDII